MPAPNTRSNDDYDNHIDNCSTGRTHHDNNNDNHGRSTHDHDHHHDDDHHDYDDYDDGTTAFPSSCLCRISRWQQCDTRVGVGGHQHRPPQRRMASYDRTGHDELHRPQRTRRRYVSDA